MRPGIAALSRYLRYRLKARSRFDIHSPFVYTFYKEVLKDEAVYPEYAFVGHLRSTMMENRDLVRRKDLGAGSGVRGILESQVQVRQLARISAIPGKYGELLFRIARQYKPKTIVELGTSLGIGTSYLAMGNPGSRVFTVEGCPATASIARRNFSMLGLHTIRVETGSFDEILPQLLAEAGTVDLCFIDGNHRKEPTVKYFSLFLQYFTNDSVLILDDIHWSREMEEAWKEIREHPSVKVTIDLFRLGLIFFSDRLSKEEFILQF
jgi:predicted O-methyltransferase YrrM